MFMFVAFSHHSWRCQFVFLQILSCIFVGQTYNFIPLCTNIDTLQNDLDLSDPFHTAMTSPKTVSKSDDSFFSSSSFLTVARMSEGRISMRVLQVSFRMRVSCTVTWVQLDIESYLDCDMYCPAAGIIAIVAVSV